MKNEVDITILFVIIRMYEKEEAKQGQQGGQL